MKITEFFKGIFTSPKPQEPFKLTPNQQALLIRKTQKLFQGTIKEEIEYSLADLASCGQINQADKLRPFTNFDANSPHTYTSQTQLQECHKYRNRALQVAAVLKQIGDGLAPLPNNSDINMALAGLNGRVNFNPLQKGHIEFANLMTKEGPIQITISDTIDIQDEKGGAIASFEGSRVISVLEPDADGTVKCLVNITYQVNDLNINLNY